MSSLNLYKPEREIHSSMAIISFISLDIEPARDGRT